MHHPWKPTTRMAAVVLVIMALLTQGCILEKKVITDIYTPVFPIGADTPVLVNTMSFGFSYCIPPGDLKFLVKPNPVDDQLTALLIQAVIVSAVNPLILDFPLQRKGKAFKGIFPLTSEVCVDPGDTLQWWVTAVGAGIAFDTKLITKLTYLAEK
jgi:hypothetical protein